MNRRDFLEATLATSLVTALASGTSTTLAAGQPGTHAAPEVALTFDDPKTLIVNDGILKALDKHRLKSILFVCGMRIDSDEGHRLIRSWDQAGHLIGNHSYSHLNFNQTQLEVFEADFRRNEPLITGYRHFTKLFRYPAFKEGDTAGKRDAMRAYLKERGYRIGRATIDASDWAISPRLETRLAREPTADLTPYRDFFLQHIWERAQYYQVLSQQVLARPVRHTVLLHHNALNAHFVGDLLNMFVDKGWHPVDAEYAYKDPVYDRQPRIAPAGESLIWALAKETGRLDAQLRYPGEDDVYENPKMDALHL
jgi:peptidoglycan-N-acetylglucosamine deacetylase